MVSRLYSVAHQLEGEEMSKSKFTYCAWAGNDQGASIDVAGKERFSSLRAIENAARAELGKGWTVHVMAIQHDGETGWFEPREIETFRIGGGSQ